MEYTNEIKLVLYKVLGNTTHDQVVALKRITGNEEISGSDIPNLLSQAKEDHKIDFQELYGVEVKEWEL